MKRWREQEQFGKMACSCIATSESYARLIAIGFEDGDVVVTSSAEASSLRQHHRAAVLSAAFSTHRHSPYLITGGADGCVCLCNDGCVERVELPHRSLSGATAGSAGFLIESIAADSHHWVAAVGKYIVLGSLQYPQALQYLSPLVHAIDAVQLCPFPRALDAPNNARNEKHLGSMVAAAAFGGVSLWGPTTPSMEEQDDTRAAPPPPPSCERIRAKLPAARTCSSGSGGSGSGGSSGDLGCDGWARSLVASPDGAWLAAWVMIAGDEPTKLWLWRTSDGVL